MYDAYQMNIFDIEKQQELQNIPGRTAYIDECGCFGFDFTKEGVSDYYILCAIIVDNTNIDNIHKEFEQIKKDNGFRNSEMKSSKIGDTYSRRTRIIHQLLNLDFKIILLIADKRKFVENSPLKEYKNTFIKYLHRRLYDIMYHVYPKLKIIEDETGYKEFQESFKKYVENNRPSLNLYNEYDFDYSDSKDNILVQMADLIAGSINKQLTDPLSPNYKDILKSKIITTHEFPNISEPYWGTSTPEDYKFNKDIYNLSIKCAQDYIEKHRKDVSEEKRLQVAFLQSLLFHVNINPTVFISSYQILSILQEYTTHKVSKDFLYRRIVAQLRDEGVIISSCSHGYKLPISVDDIITYLNQTHTIVAPMLDRVEICRNLILQQTNNNLDILDEIAFIKYKKYFD